MPMKSKTFSLVFLVEAYTEYFVYHRNYIMLADSSKNLTKFTMKNVAYCNISRVCIMLPALTHQFCIITLMM